MRRVYTRCTSLLLYMKGVNINMFMNQAKVEAIRNQYPKGTRVELVYTDDQYTKLKKGDQGNVMFVDDIGTVHINWDSGSSLGLVPGEDSFKKVPEQTQDIGGPELSM